jgi:hypothetical protein
VHGPLRLLATHRGNEYGGAQAPTRPTITNGQITFDAAGRILSGPLPEFATPGARAAFSTDVVRDVSEKFPDALPDEATAASGKPAGCL